MTSPLGFKGSLHASSPVHNGFLRFTSGVTPADLLAASMAVFPTCYICSRGRMLGFDRETSHTISRRPIHSATAIGSCFQIFDLIHPIAKSAGKRPYVVRFRKSFLIKSISVATVQVVVCNILN